MNNQIITEAWEKEFDEMLPEYQELIYFGEVRLLAQRSNNKTRQIKKFIKELLAQEKKELLESLMDKFAKRYNEELKKEAKGQELDGASAFAEAIAITKSLAHSQESKGCACEGKLDGAKHGKYVCQKGDLSVLRAHSQEDREGKE